MNARQIQQMLDKARERFLPMDGVLGVGYGMKRTGDRETDTPSLVVFVEKKLPRGELTPEETLPAMFDDWPVDVEEVRFEQDPASRESSGREEHSLYQYLDWGKIHRLNLEQKLRQGKARRVKRVGPDGQEREELDFTSPTIDVRGDLFVIDDDGTLAYTTSGGSAVLDMVGAWNLFRTRFGDDYDFAAFLLSDQDTGVPNVGNASNAIYRAATDNGYGVGAVNIRATWGGTNRLQRWVHHSWYSARTLLHEPGHQWLFFVNYRDTQNGAEQGLLHESWDSAWAASQKPFHPGKWVDNDRSCMDYDHEDWVEATPGTPGVYDAISVGDADFVFCPLDQYLMGLLNPEAVGSGRADPPAYAVSGSDFQIIANPVSNPNGTVNSTPVAITAQNIIWNEGARTPNHLNSQRVFHQAMIAITSNATTYAAFLTDMEARRANQTTNWRHATSGRSVMDTSLLRANVNDVYIRDNSGDLGGEPSTGSFWNSPDIFVRNTDDDPNLYLSPALGDSMHQKPLSNQANWIYARVHNKGNTNYDNVTVRFYLANFLGFSGHDTVAQAVPRTEVIYPIDWHPDGLIGSATLAAVPAGQTAVAKVVWPHALIPPQVDWHPCLLVEVFPLGTSPEKLHHVWDSRKLGQKNIEIQYVSADQHDFTIPFDVGHSLNPHSLAVLEIAKDGGWQDVAVYLQSKAILRNLSTVDDVLFVSIPKAAVAERVESAYLAQLIAEGLRNRWVSKNPWGVPGRESVLLPLQGFAVETLGRERVLRVADPERARLPLWLDRRTKQERLGLRVLAPAAGPKRDLTLHLVQRNGLGVVVGGIDIQIRRKR